MQRLKISEADRSRIYASTDNSGFVTGQLCRAILAIIDHLEAEPTGSGEPVTPTFAEAVTNQIPEATADDMARDASHEYRAIHEDPLGTAWAWIRRFEHERRAKLLAQSDLLSEQMQFATAKNELKAALAELAALKAQPVSLQVAECLREIRGDVDDRTLIDRLVEIQEHLRHGGTVVRVNTTCGPAWKPSGNAPAG